MIRSILFFTGLVLIYGGLASNCLAEWNGVRPDGHAPIGVMGEHTHGAGETMLSYRYMQMDMDGNRDGTSRVGEADVLGDFTVSPTDMSMEMHMFGLMLAPSDDLTLMAMVPYVEKSMNHLTRSGGRFRTNSSGLGDIKFSGLYRAADLGDNRFLFNAGVSVPSGEIDERADVPVARDAKLPYPMQLGSGTVDLLPGLTYLGQCDRWSWGAQGIGTLRLGRNDNDYSLGDRFDSTAWGAFKFSDWISTSFRTTWSVWGNIDGSDSDLNPGMVPTAGPNRRGGRRVDVGAGVNLYVPEGAMSSFRLAAEFLVPVYQNLNGPQLETDWTWIFGAQMAF